MSKRRKVGQIEKPPVVIDIESHPPNLRPFQKVALDRLALVYGKPPVFVTHRPELLPQNGAEMYFTGLPSGRNWVRERFLQANAEIERKSGPSWSLLDLDYSMLEERVMIWDESHAVLDSMSSYTDELVKYAKADAQYAHPRKPRLSDWHHDFMMHQLAADPVPMIRIHGKEIAPATQQMQDWLRVARSCGLPVAHDYYKRGIERHKPSVYVLMNAAWKAGYTCNGIDP